jgi:hypothetical protein
MTPEIREAAERATKIIELVNRNLAKWRSWFPNEESEVDVPRADLLALITLANAYLAQHPSDGDEAVTEDWLKTIGFDEKLIMELQGKWSLIAYTSSNWCLYIENSPDDYYGCAHDYDLPQPKTRRQVRQLLQALGIPTTESE